MWSRNIKNEEAMTSVGSQRHRNKSRSNIKLFNCTGHFLRRNSSLHWLGREEISNPLRAVVAMFFSPVLSFRNSLCCLLSILPQTFPDLRSSYVWECPAQVEFCAHCNWLYVLSNVQSNSIITSWEWLNIVCRYKQVLFKRTSIILWLTVRN
jgi:hypothetical protein